MNYYLIASCIPPGLELWSKGENYSFPVGVHSEPKMEPRWPQGGPKMAPRGSQEAPKWPHEGPKRPQDGLKIAARKERRRTRYDKQNLHGASARALFLRFREVPRGATRQQNDPTRPQDGHKMTPRSPKMTPRGPKMAPRGPKMAPRGPFLGPDTDRGEVGESKGRKKGEKKERKSEHL